MTDQAYDDWEDSEGPDDSSDAEGTDDESGGIQLADFAPLDAGRAIEVLACGEVELLGRMPWSSNATFLVAMRLAGDGLHAVYKPGRGERPLWDFPGGLYKREAAAWVVSDTLGWDLIPTTIVRHDGPFDEGSYQRFVHTDYGQHYFTILEDETKHERLFQMGVLDLLLNNTDRKGGHVLIDATGAIWGIDNGLCFHPQPKLRTVIWDFIGRPLPKPWIDDLMRFALAPPQSLERLLGREERDVLARRARAVAARGVFPDPGPNPPHPWPLV